jgi:hypothetical protein
MAYPDLTNTDMAYRIDVAAATSGVNPGPNTGTAQDPVYAGAGKLWLPIWSGEVLHAYDEYRMFEPMVTSKTISSGRLMEFPITGTVSLKPAWDAGEYLMGDNNSKATTFSVELDKRPMAAHFELDNIDLMITQWEYRQELARQAGQTLANARDKQIAAFIAGAAGVAKLIDDPRTGLSYAEPFAIGAGNTAAEALAVLEGIEEFCVELQENDVPVQGCYCVVPPKLFQQIRRLGVAESGEQAMNMQPMFGGVAAAGGLGAQFTQGMNGLADRLTYMGVTILKSNHIPVTDGEVVGQDRYTVNGAAAGVRGLIFCAEAVASIRKTGLVVDTEDDIRRNTTFTVASMFSGTGILKPELAKVLTSSTAGAADDRATYLGKLDTAAGQFGYLSA